MISGEDGVRLGGTQAAVSFDYIMGSLKKLNER
jgi:hypothetical protein